MYTRATYATFYENSRGREVPETPSPSRTPFQRDRDRIVHSDAFRRLQYKTQVYVNHEGDHFRTRLTHTIEVGQITRSICRALGLDEDLGETIALAHDLGHPPFGHAGEDALNHAAAEYGGFRHNVQTLRVVRQLENRYPAFDGLNLTWEALEGIAKHNGPITDEREHGLKIMQDLLPDTHASLEAQVAALADDIAYNHHDLDDALRSGILTFEQAMDHIPHFADTYARAETHHPEVPQDRLIKTTISAMINEQVEDVLRNTQSAIEKHQIETVDDVRHCGIQLVDFSPMVVEENKNHKAFMMKYVYRHYRVNRMAMKAHNVVDELFKAFMAHRRTLPTSVQAHLPDDKNDLKTKARVVADYISSLTDRMALDEYAKMFDPMKRT